MKISLLWTAVIVEFRFIKSPAGTETAEVTEIVEAMIIILALKEWLLEMVTVLGLAGTALAAATVQGWWCLSYYSSLSVSMKAWTCL